MSDTPWRTSPDHCVMLHEIRSGTGDSSIDYLHSDRRFSETDTFSHRLPMALAAPRLSSYSLQPG